MALINCFECKKEISDKAEFCPHCGVPLKASKKEAPIVVARREGCFLQFLNLGCLIWVIIIAFFVLSSFLPSVVYFIKSYL